MLFPDFRSYCWRESRLPSLERVLLCLVRVGVIWVSRAVRYLDKPWWRAVKYISCYQTVWFISVLPTYQFWTFPPTKRTRKILINRKSLLFCCNLKCDAIYTHSGKTLDRKKSACVNELTFCMSGWCILPVSHQTFFLLEIFPRKKEKKYVYDWLERLNLRSQFALQILA